MATSGVPVSTISRVLNHAEGGVTKIYNRFGYADEKREALRVWAERLDVNRGVKRGQFPVEYRSILLVQDGPLACVSYS